jgi:hypothetical protein
MPVSYPVDLRHPAAAPLVAGRKVLSLDLSIWIRLARKKTADDEKAVLRLQELVDAGRVFCPISWPLLSELQHGHNFESALPIARLMDDLCLGLAFANDRELIRSEITQYVGDLLNGTENSLAASEVYVLVSGHLSSRTHIVWPDDFPTSPEKRTAVTIQMADRLAALTVSDLITMARDSLPLPDTDRDLEYERAWKERFAFAKGDRTVMRRWEEEHAIKTWILPELKTATDRLSFLDRLTFIARLKALPRNRYQGVSAAMLERLPLIRTKVELMAIMGFNPNRKGTLNDFYDIETMIAPLAYADAFAAQDRWIKYLLTNETNILAANQVTYLPDVPALTGWLDEVSP